MSTSCAFSCLLAMSLSAANPPYLIQTIAGSDFVGDGGVAIKALLATVEGVAVDPLGNYYLADTDSHRIRRITSKGIITTLAGSGKPGFAGDNGPAALAQLNLPYGLAADLSGNLYVADFGNHCVRKIAPNGIISTVAGLTPDTQLAGPRNLTVDTSGNLYISDFTASRIYRLTPQGTFTAFAGSTTAIALGDNGPATLARLKNPAGLAVDLSGTLYVSDSGNKRIRKISGGIITSLPVSVSTPIGLSISYASELYVADYGSASVLRITNLNSDIPTLKSWPEIARDLAMDYNGNIILASGNTVRLFNGSSTTLLAGGNNYLFYGDEGPATSARLNRPLGLASDPVGNLYIADSANKRIRTVSPDGLMHSFVDGLTAPAALAIDNSSGNVYIADADNILLWKPDGKVYPLAGTGTPGFSGDGGPATKAQLNAPAALALFNGTLYVADEGNNRIRTISPDGKIQTLAQLPAPAGLAIDALGNVYSSTPGQVVLVHPSGQFDPVSNAGLWINPRGLALDLDGRLYITDPGSQRITRLDRDGAVTLLAGNGQQALNGDGLPAVLASFDTPTNILAGPNGVLYVADTGNNRIRTLTATTNIAAPITQIITLVNAASRLPGPVAAGELIALIGPSVDTADIQLNSNPILPVSSSPGEVTLALPDDLQGSLEIQLLLKGVPQARVTAPLALAALGLFPSQIFNEDGTPNSSANPANRNSTIVIHGTGEGRIGVPLTATIDGQMMAIASLTSTGNIFELTAYLPGGYFPAGPKTLQASSGTSTSQNVTIYVH